MRAFTRSANGYIAIDVYSRKDYDPEKVIDFVQELYQPEAIYQSLVSRGMDAHKHRAL